MFINYHNFWTKISSKCLILQPDFIFSLAVFSVLKMSLELYRHSLKITNFYQNFTNKLLYCTISFFASIQMKRSTIFHRITRVVYRNTHLQQGAAGKPIKYRESLQLQCYQKRQNAKWPKSTCAPLTHLVSLSPLKTNSLSIWQLVHII